MRQFKIKFFGKSKTNTETVEAFNYYEDDKFIHFYTNINLPGINDSNNFNIASFSKETVEAITVIEEVK